MVFWQVPGKERTALWLCDEGLSLCLWFGQSIFGDVRLPLCHIAQFKRDPKCVDPNEETAVEWQYNGHACTGVFQPTTSAAVSHAMSTSRSAALRCNDKSAHCVCVCVACGAQVFNFHLKSSTVVITYRILNANSAFTLSRSLHFHLSLITHSFTCAVLRAVLCCAVLCCA